MNCGLNNDWFYMMQSMLEKENCDVQVVELNG
jgi:hypothetical protein